MDQSYLNRSTHTRTQLPWAQTQKFKNDERIHNTEILKTNRLKTHTHTRQYHSDSFSCTQSAQTQICNLSLSLQQPLQTFRPRQISTWLHYLTQLSLHLLPRELGWHRQSSWADANDFPFPLSLRGSCLREEDVDSGFMACFRGLPWLKSKEINGPRRKNCRAAGLQPAPRFKLRFYQ